MLLGSGISCVALLTCAFQLTGATGFVGGHITSQLLQQGHTVRAVLRTGRTARLRSTFPNTPADRLQTIEMPSNEQGDYTVALKDVDAVIHCASPAYGKGETKEQIFEGGYKGTELLLQSAIAAGVKRIVVTGSMVSLLSPNFAEAAGTKPIDHNSTNDVDISNFDYEGADTQAVYRSMKMLTDKLVWRIATQHPDVDFSTIVLPMVIGPYVENTPPSHGKPNIANLGTPGFIYALVGAFDTTVSPNPFWQMVDVRDAAKAHVLALTAPSSAEKKRFLVSSKQITRNEVVELIRSAHPEVADRLPRGDPPFQMTAPFDLSLTESVLGLKEYIPWQESVLISLEAGLKLEKEYSANAGTQ